MSLPLDASYPLEVGDIGQGTALDWTAGGTRDTRCIQTLRLGIDLGMNVIDTAPIYESGHAEEVVGRAIAGRRNEAFVATKFSPEASRRDDVIRSAEASLRRLGTHWIDLLQVHWPHPSVPLEESLEAMFRLAEQGKVRHLGLGNCTARQIREALATEAAPHLLSVQQEYSLADRSIEAEILPLCRENRLRLLAYSPLARGKIVPDDPRGRVLTEIAAKRGLSVAQVVLAWLRREDLVLPIPRSGREEHLRENAAAAAITLDPQDVARIDRTYAMRTEPVATDEIVVPGGDRVYTTLDEAIENRFRLSPGPTDLAQRIAEGEMLKPIKVAVDRDDARRRYRLVEGRVRYWAWVIAHDGKRPIPAVVEGT